MRSRGNLVLFINHAYSELSFLGVLSYHSLGNGQ